MTIEAAGETVAGVSAPGWDAALVDVRLDRSAGSDASGETTVVPQAEAAEADAFSRLSHHVERIATGFEPPAHTAAAGSVGRLGDPAAERSAGVRPVGTDGEVPPPSYRELMQNFRAATDHAMEVTLVGSAGTSMAGSMSKLMSGQ
ncbi:MAG: hypothetical protein MUE98_10110 [Rhodobacteraceae bacterium]|jgi:hypothetical protein|nr:hypothetical protein [Paracoccaceae bacterium]